MCAWAERKEDTELWKRVFHDSEVLVEDSRSSRRRSTMLFVFACWDSEGKHAMHVDQEKRKSTQLPEQTVFVEEVEPAQGRFGLIVIQVSCTGRSVISKLTLEGREYVYALGWTEATESNRGPSDVSETTIALPEDGVEEQRHKVGQDPQLGCIACWKAERTEKAKFGGAKIRKLYLGQDSVGFEFLRYKWN